MQFNIENTSTKKWKTAADWKFASFHLSHCSRQAKPSLLFGCVVVVWCFLREISHFSYISFMAFAEKNRRKKSTENENSIHKRFSRRFKKFFVFRLWLCKLNFQFMVHTQFLKWETQTSKQDFKSRDCPHSNVSFITAIFHLQRESDGRRILWNIYFISVVWALLAIAF